jgi:hypothetical protein
MYFSMMEDLPTDWSPRKMILYLVRPPPTVLEDTLIAIDYINDWANEMVREEDKREMG